jgi:hypothetical protein
MDSANITDTEELARLNSKLYHLNLSIKLYRDERKKLHNQIEASEADKIHIEYEIKKIKGRIESKNKVSELTYIEGFELLSQQELNIIFDQTDIGRDLEPVIKFVIKIKRLYTDWVLFEISHNSKLYKDDIRYDDIRYNYHITFRSTTNNILFAC